MYVNTLLASEALVSHSTPWPLRCRRRLARRGHSGRVPRGDPGLTLARFRVVFYVRACVDDVISTDPQRLGKVGRQMQTNKH